MVTLIYIKSPKEKVRDYAEIKKEGVLRIVTEYDQSGSFVSGDEIEGFQYELSQAITKLSGVEVQLYLEMSLEKSFAGLLNSQYDIIARNIPTTSELKETCLFADSIVLNKQALVQRTAKDNDGIDPIRSSTQLQSWVVRKTSPVLLDSLNQWIRTVRENGAYK
jgi:membrane-bound lytic murein transglycosylase MltF